VEHARTKLNTLRPSKATGKEEGAKMQMGRKNVGLLTSQRRENRGQSQRDACYHVLLTSLSQKKKKNMREKTATKNLENIRSRGEFSSNRRSLGKETKCRELRNELGKLSCVVGRFRFSRGERARHDCGWKRSSREGKRVEWRGRNKQRGGETPRVNAT